MNTFAFGNETTRITWGELITALGGQEAYLKLPIFNPEGVIRHVGPISNEGRSIGRILPEMMEKPIMRGKYGLQKDQVFIAFKWIDTQNNKLYATVIIPADRNAAVNVSGENENAKFVRVSEHVSERPIFILFSGERSVLTSNLFIFVEGQQYSTLLREKTSTSIGLEGFTRFLKGETISYANRTPWLRLKKYNDDDSKPYFHPKSSARLFNETLDKDKDNFDPILLDVEKSFPEKITAYVLSEKEYNDLPILTDIEKDFCDSYNYTKRMSAPVMRGDINDGKGRALILKLVDYCGNELAVVISMDYNDNIRFYKYGCFDYPKLSKSPSEQSINIFFQEALYNNMVDGVAIVNDLDMHDLAILKRLYKGETALINAEIFYTEEKEWKEDCKPVKFVHLSKEQSSNTEKPEL
jgi:hypothetical protein